MQQMNKGVIAQMQQLEHAKKVNEQTNGLVAATVELQSQVEALTAERDILRQELDKLKLENSTIKKLYEDAIKEKLQGSFNIDVLAK